jgi:hypothetical protein
MLKERRKAAETVATALFAAERAIDQAISCTANLAGVMPISRAAANLSAMVGQDALTDAIETMRALGQARQSIINTHKQLSLTQHDIGLSAVSFGDSGEKPAVLTEGRRRAATLVRAA